jgi:hypothetical protein
VAPVGYREADEIEATNIAQTSVFHSIRANA